MLAIDDTDYVTSRKLYEVEKVGTQRDLDLVHQKYLRQKSAFVELDSKRSMIPHLQLETQAQLDAARARLQQARHELEATTITCPFEARVESIGVHEAQFVTAHLSIATLTDMGAFEISVGIDPRELRWLDRSIRPEALSDSAGPTGPDVKVRWTLHGQEFSWTGRVTRFEKIDEATRTARMVVEVRQIDMVAQTIGAGESAPALSIGMFCKTELPAAPLLDSLAVPRHAIYDNEWVYVFVADDDGSDGRGGRLERRRVPMLRSLRDDVLVDYRGRDETKPCELAPGDRVVVSPLPKPVVGMRIRLREDDVASAQRGNPGPVVNASLCVNPCSRIHAGRTPRDMMVAPPEVGTHPLTETRTELIVALAAADRDAGGR
jgi:multidrug efflux pump subunit AcrA (membrane-fusion protein)